MHSITEFKIDLNTSNKYFYVVFTWIHKTKNTLNKHAKVGSTWIYKLDLCVVHEHVVGKAIKVQAIKLAIDHRNPLYDMI